MRVMYFDRLATVVELRHDYVIVELDKPWDSYTQWAAEFDQLHELTPEAQEQMRRQLHADKYL